MIIIKTNQSGPITKPIPLTCEEVDGITVCIDAEEAARKPQKKPRKELEKMEENQNMGVLTLKN